MARNDFGIPRRDARFFVFSPTRVAISERSAFDSTPTMPASFRSLECRLNTRFSILPGLFGVMLLSMFGSRVMMDFQVLKNAGEDPRGLTGHP
jgi:hypothetical protein